MTASFRAAGALDGLAGFRAREITLAGMVSLAVNALYFAPFLLHPTLMPYAISSDAIRHDLVWKQFVRASFIATGNIPLWIPYVWSGCSLVANILTQFFYPLSLPFYFIRTELYYTYYILLHIACAGFFMYCFARLIGLSVPASALSAIFYAYGGFSAHFFQGQCVTWIVCWLPALFCSTEMLVRKKTPAWAVLSGLVMAVYFLGSHPQIFFYSVLGASAYFITRVATAREAVIRSIFLGALAFIVCIGSTAVGLFPAYEATSLSPRAGGVSLYSATFESLPIREVPLFFMPRAFGGNLTCHEGLVAFLLVIAGLNNFRRRLTLFFVALTLFSLLFSLGKYTPLYQVLFKCLPFLDLFRAPPRMLVLFGFSVPVLCGVGLDNLREASRASERGRQLRTAFRKFLIAAALCLLLSAVAFSVGRPLILFAARALYNTQSHSLPFSAHTKEIGAVMDELSASSKMILSLALAAAAALCILLWIAGKRTGLLSAAFITAAAAELAVFSLPAFSMIDPSVLYAPNALIDFLKSQGGGYRVLNMGGERILPQYLAAAHGIELADGYSPVVSMAYLEYTNRIGGLDQIGPITKLPLSDLQPDQIERPALLGLLNVKYLLSESPGNDPRFTLVRVFNDIPVYQQKAGVIRPASVFVYTHDYPMTRAFIIPRAVGCPSGKNCLELLDTLDIRNTLVVEGEKGGGEGGKGSVLITQRTSDTMSAEVYSDGPSYLFLSEIWYPGWKAYDNGRPVEVGRANCIFQYIPIQTGYHRIYMQYRPMSLTRGKWTSVLTLGAVLVYLFAAGRMRHGRG